MRFNYLVDHRAESVALAEELSKNTYVQIWSVVYKNGLDQPQFESLKSQLKFCSNIHWIEMDLVRFHEAGFFLNLQESSPVATSPQLSLLKILFNQLSTNILFAGLQNSESPALKSQTVFLQQLEKKYPNSRLNILSEKKDIGSEKTDLNQCFPWGDIEAYYNARMGSADFYRKTFCEDH